MENGLLGLVGASWAPSGASRRHIRRLERLTLSFFSRRLTSPRGRRYSSSVVTRGDLSLRDGIQLARKKKILIFRFVSGVTDELRVVGVCIPWGDAHVRTGREERKSWEDHLKYLECLPTVIDQYQGDAQPVVIAGDFNQRIPRQTQPQHVYGMLEQILLENYEVVTSGYRDDIGGYLIDRIATDGRCSAKTESIIPMNTEDGERLSDHHGVVAKIIRKMAL